MVGTVGKATFCTNCSHVVLQSLESSGPAVISVSPLGRGFSNVYVVIANLEVRTYDNPGISGIDLGFAQQCNLLNVFVNTAIYSVQAAQPMHKTSGLITPHVGNGAYTMIRNIAISGFFNGIVCNEHTDGDGVGLDCNVNGLSFANADHASRFGRVCAQRNTYDVTVSGSHGFAIQQLDVEHSGPGQTTPTNAWQKTIADINDPKNLGYGDITYWVVEGNVGAVDTFIKSGGAKILDRRIGSAAKCAPALKNDDEGSVVPPQPTAAWEFGASASANGVHIVPPNPFTDTVNGYKLLQHNESHPVVIVNASAPFMRAAAFGWASHPTWKECGNQPCGNRVYAGRQSVPKLAAISGPAAHVTVIAFVQLGGQDKGQHEMDGGGYVGGVWEESESWRQYAIFMDHTGSCKAKDGLVAHISPEGGASPGQRYCESRACGATALQPHAWHCLANTYDGACECCPSSSVSACEIWAESLVWAAPVSHLLSHTALILLQMCVRM